MPVAKKKTSSAKKTTTKTTTKKSSSSSKKAPAKKTGSFGFSGNIGKAKNLLIVESPTEKSTISRWLDPNEFAVEATIGHFKQDSSKCLDIDMKTLLPKLRNDPYKSANIERIRKQVEWIRAKGGKVFIQTDDDREWVGIAWSVITEFKLKKSEYCRVVVNALEEKQYLKALANPEPDIDWKMVDSWFARSALDKFIGYGVSPAIWKFSNQMHGMGLSAGRVQSAALNMLSVLEERIKAFKGGTVFSLHCEYEWGFTGDMEGEYMTKEEAAELLWKIKDIHEATIDQYKEWRSEKKPKEPFRTSTIQQACSSNLSISPDMTMSLLQDGFRMGKNTYMRTDSVTLPEEYLEKLGEFIKEKYGEKFYCRRDWENKKGVQAGHTGIYPVHIERDFPPVDEYGEVYDILKRRTLASQMIPAVFSTQSLLTDIGGHKFSSRGRKLIEKGYLIVYDVEEDKEDDSDNQSNIPRELKNWESLKVARYYPTKHELRPPVRLNAAALVGRLEDLRIGRPSTFASIIKTLIEKDYITVEWPKQIITVTDRGLYVAKMLRIIAPQIVNLDFTAEMEDKLDIIASGKLERKAVVEPFLDQVVYTTMRRAGIKFDDKGLIEKLWPPDLSPMERAAMDELWGIDDAPKNCPSCGSEKYKFIPNGRYWPFFKCADCNLIHGATDTILESKCPSCGKPMLRTKSKKGDTYFRCVDKDMCGHFTSVEPGME